MAKQLQLRGGTTAEHAAFTGAARELTIDTDTNTLVVHDGSTVGGHTLTSSAVTQQHLDDTGNPHAVTKAQVGLTSVDDKSSTTIVTEARAATTKADVGLSDVDNTSDTAKNVLSATKLATARTIALDGDVSGSISFDGTANKTITAVVANDSHTHDGRYFTESESDGRYLGKTAKAADSEKLDGLDSSYFTMNQGSNTQDPNTAYAPYILTNHANTPDSSRYWHIRTQCYSTPSTTANRAQIAIEYSPAGAVRTYTRSCYSDVWKAWVRCDNNGTAVNATKWNGSAQSTSTSAASGGVDGDIWFQY